MREGGFTNWVEFEEAIGKTSVSKGPPGETQLVGLLFMRAGQKLTDGEIVPSLDYFNARSAKTDFVLPGWKYDLESAGHWSFDENAFVAACKVIRENTKWKYSGGTELLLFEAHKGKRTSSGGIKDRGSSTSVFADFSSAVTVRLDELIHKKLVQSPEVVFERIFSYAEHHNGGRPLAGLAFQEARVSGAAAIVQGVLSYLPKEVKEQIEYAKEFAVQDISKPSDAQLKVISKHTSWSL